MPINPIPYGGGGIWPPTGVVPKIRKMGLFSTLNNLVLDVSRKFCGISMIR